MGCGNWDKFYFTKKICFHIEFLPRIFLMERPYLEESYKIETDFANFCGNLEMKFLWIDFFLSFSLIDPLENSIN